MMLKRRSAVKALTWRSMSTVVTGLLAFTFFGSWETCGWLMLCDFVSKLLLYYYHERVWLKTSWGRE
jgi:uncharacterized membrane protein